MAAAKPSPSSSSPIPKESIQKAVAALLKWKQTKSEPQTQKLLEQDESFYLILTLKKIPPPTPSASPFKIPLPHPLFDPASSEICLLLDDAPRSKLTVEAAERKVKQDGVPVSKVLKLSKLRANYKAFEAKRELCDSYDLFLADKGVLPVLPKLLGKQFRKRRKVPVGVDLRRSGWKEQVENAVRSALLFLGSGTCSVVRVARLSMSREEIVENVAAAIAGVAETVPKKWKNVRSLHLKLPESLALPVYQTVPDVKFRIEGGEGEDKEEGGAAEGGGKNESLGKKKKMTKGMIREVRYMDIDLDEDEGDGYVDSEDRREFKDNADEEVDVGHLGGKIRKKGKESGLGDGAKRKKLNGSTDHIDDGVLGRKDEDFALLSDDKRLKKLNSALTNQGKPKNEEGKGRTDIATFVVGGNVSEDKKKERKGRAGTM